MAGNMTSRMSARFIDSNYLFTSFISQGSSSVRDQFGVWDLRRLSMIKQFILPKGVNYELFQGYYIFKKYPVITLYFTNGIILFYRLNESDPFFVFNAYGNIVKALFDEKSNELFTMSTNGTVKCFDINKIFFISNIFEPSPEKNKLYPFYPNPASEYLNFYPENKFEKIEIYSIIGMKLVNSGFEDRIDISNLSPGIYFIKLNNIFYKFIKI
jgi:hypothetical protein